MSPPSFPIGPEGLLGHWEFLPLLPGDVRIGDGRLQVTAARIRHKGGPTYGLRVTGPDGATAAYLPDHMLTTPDDLDGSDLVAGVDLLLHDGQFTSSQASQALQYGHSTIDATIAYADRNDARELVFLHHHPDRTDVQIDEMATVHTRTPGGRADPVRRGRRRDRGRCRRPVRTP